MPDGPDNGALLNNQQKLYQQYQQTFIYDGTVDHDRGSIDADKSNVQLILHEQAADSQLDGQLQQYLRDVFHGLFPEMTDVDAGLEVLRIIKDLNDKMTANTNEQLKVSQQNLQQKREEKAKLLADAAAKMEEAKAKSQDVDIWTKIKLAFQWIGAAIMVAVGAVLTATGAAPLGAMLIILGVLALMAAADSTTGALSSAKLGIAGNVFLAMGVNKDEASKLDLAYKIGGALLTTGIAIAMFWLPTTEMSLVQQWAQLASSVGTIVVDVGTASGDTFANVTNYKATQDEADAKNLQAAAKSYEADASLVNAYVEELIQRLGDMQDRYYDMLGELSSAIDEHNKLLLRITFKS